ncbi:MAG: hypothetical protein ABMA64_05515 [Myxococcota bacterium]
MGSKKWSRINTPEEKANATARASEIGAAAVSRELDISAGTLSCWVFLARKAGASAGSVKPQEAPAPAAPAEPPATPTSAMSSVPVFTPLVTAALLLV